MVNFILACFVCFFAMFGITTAIRKILETFKYKSNFEGVEHCIYLKNAEQSVEGYVRDIVFKYPNMKNLVIIDMNSTDHTYEILEKLQKEYEFIRIIKYSELV